MLDFQSLKNTEASFEALNKTVESMKGGFPNDETYWKPTKDKAGNAYAVIRFLDRPGIDGADAVHIVQYYDHSFQGPSGDWYIEKCLSTFQKKDPVQTFAAPLWKGSDEDKKLAATIKRKRHYVSNILVIDDPAAPENNGKVFRFKYGQKIFQKIEDARKPPFPNMPPLNAFDMWKGANFQLRMRTVDKWPNYDLSTFDPPTPLGTDEYIKQIWEKCYSLKAIVDPSQFKDYETLERRFQEVMAGTRTPRPKEDVSAPEKRPTLGETVAKERETINIDDAIPFEVDSGDDDEVKYFKNLADEE
jgi:hypothetical protein